MARGRAKIKSISVGIISDSQRMKFERAASREAEMSLDPTGGFKSTSKVHKSAKAYSRKTKYKSAWDA